MDDLFWCEDGFRGGKPLLIFTSIMLEAVRFFLRHHAIGSGRNDRVFAPSPVPVSGKCVGVDECAGYRTIWGIGAVRTRSVGCYPKVCLPWY